MTDTTPRPCHQTAFALIAVVLAGLALGAFSPPPAATPAQVQLPHKTLDRV